MVHEVFHVLGAVPECASNRAPLAHVSDDPSDIMYARRNQGAGSVLDWGRDDYYGHGNSDCLDIAESVVWEPALPGAAPLPEWPSTDMASLSCDPEMSIRPPRPDSTTNVQLVNTTDRTLTLHFPVYSLNDLLPAGTLAPRQIAQSNQIVGQHLLVAESDGQCLAVYQVQAGGRAIIR